MAIDQFHFLRPEWLLLLPLAAIICWLLWRRQLTSSSWQAVIDPGLLDHLLDREQGTQQRWPLLCLAAALLLAILALAGPAWHRLPQAVAQKEDALLIVLDLSLSMRANDISPSRVERAQLKLRDVLAEREEGLTALIVYAGDAHTVAPFTDDARTIESMLPALQPEIMPKLGSRPEYALALGQQLLSDAQLSKARVLLVTDGIQADQLDALQDALGPGMALSVLGVGTPEGSPIPLPEGGFLKDASGEIIVAQLDEPGLQSISSQLGGRYSPLTASRQDIDRLLPDQLLDLEIRDSEREFDVWHDEGAVLVLLLLPFCLLGFRRGLLLPLLLIGVLPPPAHADDGGSWWADLWQTRDQQAQQALSAGDAEQAQKLFRNRQWKASAAYRAGDYEQAGELFGEQNAYNRGNALAKAGDLQGAIAAYDEVLAANPEHEDAAFNKKLLEELQQQQQQNQQNQNNQDSEQPQNNDQNQEQQNQNQQQQQQQQENQEQNAGQDKEQPSSQENPQQNPQENSDNKESQDQPQEHAENEQTPPPTEPQEDGEPQSAQAQAKPDSERQQELEQWLRKVPDDPGGLLKNKFRYQYEQNRRRRKHYDKEGSLY